MINGLNRFPQKDVHSSILTELERTFAEAGLLVKLLKKEEAGFCTVKSTVPSGDKKT